MLCYATLYVYTGCKDVYVLRFSPPCPTNNYYSSFLFFSLRFLSSSPDLRHRLHHPLILPLFLSPSFPQGSNPVPAILNLLLLPLIILLLLLRLPLPPHLGHRLRHSFILLILHLIPLDIIFIRNLFDLPPIPIRLVDQGFPFLQIEALVGVEFCLAP